MEWRFGGMLCCAVPDAPVLTPSVSAGSSEVRRGGSAFLQLKLAVNNGSKTDQVYMGEPTGVSRSRVLTTHVQR